MNEVIATEVFDRALKTYRPGFGTYFLPRLLELDISCAEGVCTVLAPARDFLFNPQGALHGGIIATILDISMGSLLHHAYGVGGATLEMKIQYLEPVAAGGVRCEARFLKRGRSIAFLEARLFAETGRLAAAASSTWKPMAPPQS